MRVNLLESGVEPHGLWEAKGLALGGSRLGCGNSGKDILWGGGLVNEPLR